MNTEPLIRTNPEFLLWILVGIVIACLVGIAWNWAANRRASRDLLRVCRAPDTSTDYRDSLARHARELQLKESRR
jgi:hypothetical protein